jgi:hypothetical protein
VERTTGRADDSFGFVLVQVPAQHKVNTGVQLCLDVSPFLVM